METQKDSKGWLTFLEHWGFFLTALLAVVVFQLFLFFVNLSGTPWICFFVVSFALMILGGSMIGYAKFPAYRSGHFFTYGVKSVPQHLRGLYRRGWRVFLSGVVLSLCLSLSRL